MSNLLVSVIIPSYNYEKHIAETIDSVLQQSYAPIEIIVIDDGSTDGTRSLIDSMKHPNLHYYYQENGGLSSARNLGIQKSKGTYLQFLDADDLLEKDKIKNQVAAFESDPDLLLCYTDAYYFEDLKPNAYFKTLGLTHEEWIPQLNTSGAKVIEALIYKNIFPVNAVLTKKQIFNDDLKFNTEFKSLEDWDVWLKCAFKNYKFKFLNAPKSSAIIRVHSSSMSQNKGKMYLYELRLRLEMIDFIQKSSILSEHERNGLLKFNTRKQKSLISFLIKINGFFNLKSFKEIIDKVGFISFISAYFKAINDIRKGHTV